MLPTDKLRKRGVGKSDRNTPSLVNYNIVSLVPKYCLPDCTITPDFGKDWFVYLFILAVRFVCPAKKLLKVIDWREAAFCACILFSMMAAFCSGRMMAVLCKKCNNVRVAILQIL